MVHKTINGQLISGIPTQMKDLLTSNPARTHGYITTISGIRVMCPGLRSSMVRWSDIANSLAMQVRYLGHIRFFYCPTPDQRILTADLRWVPAGDLRVGDELFGFDEHPKEVGRFGKKRRRFKHSRILTARPVVRNVIRLEMEDGSTVDASEEHPWLIATKASRNQKWQTARQIADAVQNGRRRYMHRFMQTWTEDSSRDAGYLAGIYDGEGHFSFAARRGVQLGVSQRPGFVLDEVRRIMRDKGFQYSDHRAGSGDVRCFQSKGGWREALRIMGSLRTLRLIPKVVEGLRDGTLHKQLDGEGEPMRIVAAHNIGRMECAGLETSSRTYLCEGFGAHNSVADHSILVSQVAQAYGETTEVIRACFMHDVHEAYVGDFPSPFKNVVTGLSLFEKSIEAAVRDALNLPSDDDPIWQNVKQYDILALHAEAACLFQPIMPEWVDLKISGLLPLTTPVVGREWQEGKAAFLQRSRELGIL